MFCILIAGLTFELISDGGGDVCAGVLPFALSLALGRRRRGIKDRLLQVTGRTAELKIPPPTPKQG